MPQPRTTTLCDRCRKLDFYQSGFDAIVPVPLPTAPTTTCDLCKLFEAVCKSHEIEPGESVSFIKRGSTLKISDQGSELPVLSILGCPSGNHDPSIQLGLPPEAEFEESILANLLNMWLDNCDCSHESCGGLAPGELPTRLIEVGRERNSPMRLVNTKDLKLAASTRYVALSHPWGDTERFKPFRTYRTDETGEGHDEATFMQGINYNDLPTTFSDAVDVARFIGVSYLWIDSVCILQGADGDFDTEAKRMQAVFNGAYCVIAANAAHHQHDGFLNKRVPCNYVRIEPKESNQGPLYICEGVDDFNRDVLKSHLNGRGWVLQERALARRSIFFTKTQAYFECGEGIRCESFTRMKHSIVGLLGDPHFPSKVLESKSKGQKIVYFQELFKTYSRLSFSSEADRSIAINGLETRLQQACESDGQFGVFGHGKNGGFFRYTLLWMCEEAGKRLTRIKFHLTKLPPVPTWSWMAYNGPIDYLKIPLGEVEWLEDIQPLWSTTLSPSKGTSDTSKPRGLSALTRLYDVSGRIVTHKIHFDLDLDLDPVQRVYRCVVVGKKNSSGPNRDKEHYVLIVTPKEDAHGKVFERVGVASMLGSQILWDEAPVQGQIV